MCFYFIKNIIEIIFKLRASKKYYYLILFYMWLFLAFILWHWYSQRKGVLPFSIQIVLSTTYMDPAFNYNQNMLTTTKNLDKYVIKYCTLQVYLWVHLSVKWLISQQEIFINFKNYPLLYLNTKLSLPQGHFFIM